MLSIRDFELVHGSTIWWSKPPTEVRASSSIEVWPQLTFFSRMFTVSITEEVNALTEDINAVMEKIDDPMICEKLKRFVYAPREIQDMFKADASVFFK